MGKMIVCLVGLIVLTAGIRLAKKQQDFLKKGKETIGKIIDFKTDMQDSWVFICEYTTEEQGKVKAAENLYRGSTMGRSKKIGKQVSIIYNRENPQEFMIKNNLRMIAETGMVIAAGVIVLCVGIFVVK